MREETFTATIDGVAYTFGELKNFAIGANPVMLDKVSKINHYMLRSIVSSNSRASEDTLLWLSKTSAPVFAALIRNKSTPVSVWFELAKNSDAKVRGSIAAAKRVPYEVLEYMAEVENTTSVLNKILSNTLSGYSIHRIFVTSKNFNKQRMVFKSDKIETEILYSLVQNPKSIRFVIENKGVPTYLLERILSQLTVEQKLLRKTVVNALALKPEYVDWPEEWFEDGLGAALYQHVQVKRDQIHKILSGT